MTAAAPVHPRWHGMIAGLLLPLLVLFVVVPSRAAEVIPPVPDHYFNDYANVVSPRDADQFNRQLEQFERDTSNQILVAIYPKMQTDSDIADYTFRIADSWRIGQKGKNNGAVLFVFIQDHQLFIQVNYGLEGALPDATCKQIIDEQITPKFKTGDYTGGLRDGINAILAATRGEYKGNGSTVNDSNSNNGSGGASIGWIILFIILFAFLQFMLRMTNIFNGRSYYGNRRSYGYFGGWGGGFGGGGFGGGGFGGGGGFSGGGGMGGGGGAGGSW